MLRTPTASNVDRSLQAMEHHDNASATCVQKDNMHDYFKQNYVSEIMLMEEVIRCFPTLRAVLRLVKSGEQIKYR